MRSILVCLCVGQRAARLDLFNHRAQFCLKCTKEYGAQNEGMQLCERWTFSLLASGLSSRWIRGDEDAQRSYEEYVQVQEEEMKQ